MTRRGRDRHPVLASEIEHLYVNLGRAHELSGVWEGARAAYEELRERGRRLAEPRLEWAALNRLAILSAQSTSDLPRAIATLEEALKVAEANDDRAMLAETEWNFSQMYVTGLEGPAAISHGERALSLARELNAEELTARCLATLTGAYGAAGRFEESAAAARRGAALYARLEARPEGERILSAQHAWAGSPPSVAASRRAMRAQCLCILAVALVNLGEVRPGIEAAREAAELGRELKNGFVRAHAANNLVHGLTEAGEYEEALRVAREGVGIARGAPSLTLLLFQLVVLGNALLAMWRPAEAREAYLEALELTDTTDPLRRWKSVVVPKLCPSRTLAGDWTGAHDYALESLGVRDELPTQLIWMDFLRHHETEALLRGGNEELARDDIRRLGGRIGNNRRFRLVHLRMLAVLHRWRGDAGGALERLREAEALAGEIGLPGELWQIQAGLGELHEERGEPAEAREAFARASRVVRVLAGKIADEELREGFLGAPPVRRLIRS